MAAPYARAEQQAALAAAGLRARADDREVDRNHRQHAGRQIEREAAEKDDGENRERSAGLRTRPSARRRLCVLDERRESRRCSGSRRSLPATVKSSSERRGRIGCGGRVFGRRPRTRTRQRRRRRPRSRRVALAEWDAPEERRRCAASGRAARSIDRTASMPSRACFGGSRPCRRRPDSGVALAIVKVPGGVEAGIDRVDADDDVVLEDRERFRKSLDPEIRRWRKDDLAHADGRRIQPQRRRDV